MGGRHMEYNWDRDNGMTISLNHLSFGKEMFVQ